MIIGNGLIGKALKSIDSDEYLFFASGVSDSKTNDESKFQREISLLREYINLKDKKFIYFSSCSIYDTSLSEQKYVKHKLNVEHIIQEESDNYLIVRIGNIVGGGGNSNNIMNFIYESISQKKNIEVWKGAERNLLDIEDLIHMLGLYLNKKETKNNQLINLNNPNGYTILEIIKEYERELGINGVYTIINKGSGIDFDTGLSQELFDTLDINNEIYLSNIIKKYYTGKKV